MLAAFILTCSTVLVVSFLCSLTEAVLLSLNPLALRLEHSRQQSPCPAGRWLVMKNQIERPISAILVFNTLANTGLATVAGALYTKLFGEQWLWLFSILITLIVLFGTEMLPKVFGVYHAEWLAPRLIGPLTWMLRICHPIVLLMDSVCARLKARTASRKGASEQIMDIITLVRSARAEQLLHSREEIIMIHAATLSARRVKTAMVPAAAIRLFDLRLSLLENVQASDHKLHRSYPVSKDGTLAGVTGYVRVRELFVQNLIGEPGAPWMKQVRPALRIDGKASLTQLLALFLEKQEVAALVDQPDGTIVGWVTMDDVMKVLMGARV